MRALVAGPLVLAVAMPACTRARYSDSPAAASRADSTAAVQQAPDEARTTGQLGSHQGSGGQRAQREVGEQEGDA